ncbi:MAG: hypothetical protein R3323_08610 [Wenzhouxiangellaceae bacterium]|nr:hypothetical protein [Wenzhouxiangellaceae bacterium]
MMQSIPRIAGLVAGLWLVAVPAWLSAQDDAVEPQPAQRVPLADESLLLDVKRIDDRFVAVGARGHVLLSDDGRNWTQAEAVPVRATLTRVTGAGRRMWAVGHDATIVSSMDGGQTWFIQHFDPEAEEPLFDAAFLDPDTGYAIGAYGRFMSTGDGGINWNTERLADRVVSEAIDWQAFARQQDDIDTLPDDYELPSGEDASDFIDKGCYEFDECHLNAILVLDEERLMIAAEGGYGYRSTDGGETWESFRFPYPGSMFGLVRQQDCILAFGLRGNIQKSCDFGDSWSRLEVEGEQTLLGGTRYPDDRVVLVGSGATRITITPDGASSRASDRLGSDFAAVALAGNDLILVGEDGVRHE